jgi:hypothetical protein
LKLLKSGWTGCGFCDAGCAATKTGVLGAAGGMMTWRDTELFSTEMANEESAFAISRFVVRSPSDGASVDQLRLSLSFLGGRCTKTISLLPNSEGALSEFSNEASEPSGFFGAGGVSSESANNDVIDSLLAEEDVDDGGGGGGVSGRGGV